MEPAVTTVLDWTFFLPILQRRTRWETRMNFARFPTEPEARSWAAGGISGSCRRQLLK
mgnify:CR=1 FL=1